jgi:3-deoxy-D-manno-octulosonate 8-phosphate phosphatase (KDO 8-P phosphatase)
MKSNLFSKVIKIDALLFDVDGVMTDGKIYSSDNGECFKAFNASDGLGIKLLNEFNIITGVISGRDSESLRHRLQELDIRYSYLGVQEKLSSFNEFLSLTGLKPEQVAYIGDDLPDLPILKRCGFSASPKNGSADLIQHVDYVTEKSGGDGSIREVAEIILKSKGFWDMHLQSLC